MNNLLSKSNTYTGRFIMFSVIINIYNKKTKFHYSYRAIFINYTLIYQQNCT